MQLTLDTPIRYVPRVGPSSEKKLQKLEIQTVSDLLLHIPYRYNDYSVVKNINELVIGETVTIVGSVQSMKNIVTKTHKFIQQAVITDDTGSVTLSWFNQVYLTRVILPTMTLAVSGQYGFIGKTRSIIPKEFEILGENGESVNTGRLVPVYHETAGVSSKWLRGRIAFLLENLKDVITDPIPQSLLDKYNYPSRLAAIQAVHFPSTQVEAEKGRERLAFEELFILQLRAMTDRKIRESSEIGPVINQSKQNVQKALPKLPFTLTNSQIKALTDITDDFAKTSPMNRLLEGDVGAGKTAVAALAMLITVQSGYSAVLMAPTQILAEQHYQSIQKLLAPFAVPIHLVTGSINTIKDGRPTNTKEIIIGTHALLSETIQLDTIGLVIIDEQQRFGVEQRSILKKKGAVGYIPHLLTMTATPIPRTLALTLYGNLDLTLLTDMPKGRKSIKTWVVPNQKREAAYAWIKKQVAEENNQVFIVCPFIDVAESMETAKAATVEFSRLQSHVYPDLRVALLHGKMKPKEKSEVLEAFTNRKVDILVATPVVEVGIDIPDATVIVIEAADRFGLSQLHQLRGRVGRNDKQSYCLLFTDEIGEQTLIRLKAMETLNNGPELAEIDLQLRGPGALLGTKQHGALGLKIAKFTDLPILSLSHDDAQSILTRDPTLEKTPFLKNVVKTGTISTITHD